MSKPACLMSPGIRVSRETPAPIPENSKTYTALTDLLPGFLDNEREAVESLMLSAASCNAEALTIVGLPNDKISGKPTRASCSHRARRSDTQHEYWPRHCRASIRCRMSRPRCWDKESGRLLRH